MLSHETGSNYSTLLTQHQKAFTIIDRDLQQLVHRSIRSDEPATLPSLIVQQEDYIIEFTRGGRRNPLHLARSNMQRVAYDIGEHPAVDDEQSIFYKSTSQFLRRHSWQALDRTEKSPIKTQALLADIEKLSITVITEDNRYLEWPLPKKKSAAASQDDEKIIGIEFSWLDSNQHTITRLFPVL